MALGLTVLDIPNITEEPLHVYDLPQLYTKPSTSALLEVLELLQSAPSSWESTPHQSGVSTPSLQQPLTRNGYLTPPVRRRRVKPEGVTAYLTSIISSKLRWVADDEDKERIWEEASLRLSERSGRTGMPAISRPFHIPVNADGDTVSLLLHEPALTADNLGLKTWASSYLLAKRLHLLGIPVRADEDVPTILELGAGTGLVGLSAAAVFGAKAYLTDLPEIVPNLERNVATNQLQVASCGGDVAAGILDWAHPTGTVQGREICRSFPLILAADSLYSPEHPKLLCNAINALLERSEDARVVVEFPLREAYASEREEFRILMKEMGMQILAQGEEVGFDDWGDEDKGGLSEVECWWSIWTWAETRSISQD